MNLYEKRVQRLHDHVMAHTKEEGGKKPSIPSTVKELQAALTEKGIEYPSNARKEELIKLLEESETDIDQTGKENRENTGEPPEDVE